MGDSKPVQRDTHTKEEAQGQRKDQDLVQLGRLLRRGGFGTLSPRGVRNLPEGKGRDTGAGCAWTEDLKGQARPCTRSSVSGSWGCLTRVGLGPVSSAGAGRELLFISYV